MFILPRLPRRSRALYAFAAVLALAIGLVALTFVGFQASDDASYLAGGLGWLEHFPYVGGDHWTLRHTITIPVAASVSVFGLNESAVALPSTLYFLALLLVNTAFAARFLGSASAIFTALLVVTMPGFVVLASYLNADLAELFYLSVAFWLFVLGVHQPASVWPWVLSGLSAGLAFLTRETAIAFPLFLGLLCLFRPSGPRSRYFYAAAGFAAVILSEWTYLSAMTGEPLYRYRLDLHHDIIDRAAEVARVRLRAGLIDKEGNLSVNVYLDPILNLFVSQKYTILSWLALPAAFRACQMRRGPESRATTLGLLGGIGFVYYLTIALNPRLYLVPRYLLVFAWAASGIVGWWLSDAWARGRRRLVAGALGLALVANGTGLLLENTNPAFAWRQLAAIAKRHPQEAIHVVAETENRTQFFLKFQQLPKTALSSAKPTPNNLVFLDTGLAERCALSSRCRPGMDGFEPSASWTVVERSSPPQRPAAWLVRRLGLERVLPSDLARKLLRQQSELILFRVN